MSTKLNNEQSTQSVSRLKAIAIVSGLLGMIAFLALPFLPVKQTQTSFDWPQEDSLNSVYAPLISYAPDTLDIEVPLSVLDDLNPGQTNVISTLPPDSKDANLRGLQVRYENGELYVIIQSLVPVQLTGEEVDALPSDAVLKINSAQAATKVEIPGGTKQDGSAINQTIDDSDMRPQVTGIYTELADTQGNADNAIAAGLHAHAEINSRFSSTPTLVKQMAMWIGIISTIVALIVLWRMDRLISDKKYPVFHGGLQKFTLLDGIVSGILVVWHFIGANTADDGYLLNMARTSDRAGYMSNYYRWFGVPESPFGAPYYDVLSLLSHISTAPIFMKLPELLAGLFTWVLLSRAVLPRLGESVGKSKAASWSAALVFLAFWMVFNNGLRPEPVIALGALATWVLVERAISEQKLFPAAMAVLVAAFTLAAGPTGLMAVASLVAGFSAILRIIVRRMPVLGGDSNQSRGRRFATLLAQIAPFLTVGTSVLMAIFADQTFGGVREAITVRGSYGPNLPWYMEYTRYTELFGNEVDGSLTRRFCVMITFFALFMVISAILRYRVIPGTNSASVMRLVVTFVGSLFLMTFTPTKWTHHFGAWAGIAGALAGVAAVAIVVAMRHSSRNRTFLWSGIMFLLAFALAGKNAWWYISSSGIPWFDKSISYHGIEASLVVLAISLLILIIGLGANLYRDMKRTSEIAENQEITADTEDPKENFRGWKQALQAPIAVVTALIVLLSLASFAKGAWSLRDGYTVAKGNIRALAGNTCNLAESVMVETDTNESFLQPIKGDLKDSLTTKNSYGFRPNAVPNDIRMEFKKEKTSTVSIESSPEMDQSTANASSTSGSSSSNSSSTSSSEQYENTPGAQQVEVAQSGLAAGYRAEPGINGSHAKLPYDIDPNKVPVMGSFSDGVQIPARTYTEWYDLGERSPERPLLVMSVAGPVGYYDVSGKWEFGQDIFVHYGKKNPDGSVTPVGNPDGNRMYNTGEAPRWRNLRLPMDEIPEDVDVIQIEAHDFNVTPDQWLVITPPRTPQMESMAEFLPDDAPTQLDWPVGLQFPCQRPFDHWGGVAELAQFRINSGDKGIELTPVMDYYGGGLLGMLEGTASETEIATYLQGDWAREWGNLEYYTLYKNSRGQEPKEAKLNTEIVQRSGLWNPTPMLRKKDG